MTMVNGVPVDYGTGGDLTMHLIETSVWSDEMVAGADIAIVDVPFVTVGGGLGSLGMVEYLRVAGVPGAEIRILSAADVPQANFRYLAENSQITERDPLRSPSDVTMDNVWGWPGYALRQAVSERSFKPLWTVLTEPILSESFNPRAVQLYGSVEREAQRLRWETMLVQGHVRTVRRRVGGGYFVILASLAGATSPTLVAYRATYVHLAVGYPALRFLPDLRGYRCRYHDYSRVVNAYEPHEHVYERLSRAGGTVIVRGAGIVCSRILQRLIDDRDTHGRQVRIIHVVRPREDLPSKSLLSHRDRANGFTYQDFVYAKAAMGGQHKGTVQRLEGQLRAGFIKTIGGSTTPKRRRWQRQLNRARREGWYRTLSGEVRDLAPGPDGALCVRIALTDQTVLEVSAEHIIDATGLACDIGDSPVLTDLFAHMDAEMSAVGRLEVGPTFEVRGTRSEPGRLYASGAATLGGPYAPVDSFLGTQYAALQICDDLAQLSFCKHIGAGRSIAQWWRWVRGLAP